MTRCPFVGCALPLEPGQEVCDAHWSVVARDERLLRLAERMTSAEARLVNVREAAGYTYPGTTEPMAVVLGACPLCGGLIPCDCSMG